MSREDPQFKLRMQPGLKAKIEEAAATNNRSLNAEITTRLEASFFQHSPGGALVPAAKARELAEIARQGLPEVIRQRVLEAINRAIGLGHSAADVELDDLGLEGGMSEEETQSVLGGIDNELLQAGYKVEWNGPSGATIFF